LILQKPVIIKSLAVSLILLFTIVLPGFTQQTWTNYANDRLIEDVLVDGHDVWVGSQGGLTRTNIETREFQT